MEDNSSLILDLFKALDAAKVFLDKVTAEDEAVLAWITSDDGRFTIALVEKILGKKFDIEGKLAYILEIAAKVENIANNGKLVIKDLADILNILQNITKKPNE